jgi:hypothetical protein
MAIALFKASLTVKPLTGKPGTFKNNIFRGGYKLFGSLVGGGLPSYLMGLSSALDPLGAGLQCFPALVHALFLLFTSMLAFNMMGS